MKTCPVCRGKGYNDTENICSCCLGVGYDCDDGITPLGATNEEKKV